MQLINWRKRTHPFSRVEQVLGQWGREGVLGWFSRSSSQPPFKDADKAPLEGLAALLGALPTEVVAMNGLSVNLHLMLAAFYRPSQERYKIIVEEAAFPSDMVRTSSPLASILDVCV